MMNNSIYNQIITSKTGQEIPVLRNGKTIESRYNPEREAENQCSQFDKNTEFFLFIGIGSGILIKKTLDKFLNAKILCAENSSDDLIFLQSLPLIKKISESKQVIFCTKDTLAEKLCQEYIPALHGNLTLYENHIWEKENQEAAKEIKTIINKSLSNVSADFSVQAHFGKIWQSNIMKNLKLASKLQITNPKIISKNKAAVIAAGPSFDKTIKLLNSDYYIIATDTAFSSLIKNNIIPDAVVSLDGQTVSYNHYMDIKGKLQKEPLFYFDLSANFSAAKKLSDKGFSIRYFISGHPLSQYAAESSEKSLISLYSGSGTVTITAVDLAVKLGFTKIDIFGADFSYSKGKAYTRGTYLESLYALSSDRNITNEKLFARLMFRTELINCGKGKYSTKVLESYKESLENYLKTMNLNFIISDDLYRISCQKNQAVLEQEIQNFNYEGFIKRLKNEANNSYVILLPYIAWLRKKMNFTSCKFDELCKLASNSLLSYN